MTSNLQLARLPKITDDLRESYGADIRLIDNDCQWTQEAVDFVAEVAYPSIRAEIERLTEELDTHLRVHLGVVRENVKLRGALEKISALSDDRFVPKEWERIARAALAGDETSPTLDDAGAISTRIPPCVHDLQIQPNTIKVHSSSHAECVACGTVWGG